MERERIEEIAANRLQIITPVLDPALDKAKHQTIKESISIQYGINERTILGKNPPMKMVSVKSGIVHFYIPLFVHLNSIIYRHYIR